MYLDISRNSLTDDFGEPNQFQNGYLFERYRNRRADQNPSAANRPVASVHPPLPPCEFHYTNPNPPQYFYTPQTVPVLHRGSPVPPAGENLSSVPSVSSATNSTNSSRCTWTSTESKCVIESMKVHFSRLTGTKSSKGKRALWESIFSEFQALCRENDVETNKNANQVKEKWRTLFDRYKQVCDHNKQTGRDSKTFEFYDAIDEFMHESDKVNPKFVKQTAVLNLQNKESGELEDADGKSGDDSLDTKDNDKENAPVDGNDVAKPEVVTDVQSKCIGKRPAKKDQTEVASKKKKRSSTDGNETEAAILQMLENQQAAMERAEKQDQRHFEALMQYQNQAEERHNRFVCSVLGKLGELFKK